MLELGHLLTDIFETGQGVEHGHAIRRSDGSPSSLVTIVLMMAPFIGRVPFASWIGASNEP